MPTISFVIPVFRNERAVSLTYQKIRDVCETALPSYEREFVFVDDGSDDGSLAELLSLRERDTSVRVISFTRNFGQMAAILAGLKACTGDFVLQLSADLQDPVELMPQMVAEAEKGAEVVVAYRSNREDRGLNAVTSRLFYAIVRMSFPQIPPGGFDYVLMRRRVLPVRVIPQVSRVDDQANTLVTRRVPAHDVDRAIGRAIITYHNFGFIIALLHQHAVECLANKICVVICDETNADFW